MHLLTSCSGMGIGEGAETMAPEYHLLSCVWEITLACCFSCRYCGSRAGRMRSGELDTAECLEVVRQLADLGCRRVSLIGGEVFLRPDWPDIAASIAGQGMSAAIVTNGWLISDAIIDQLKEVRIESVAISLDGPREIHDRYRQEGSFDRAIQAIGALAENGIAVSAITTLHSQNAGHLDEMYEILEGCGICAWQLQACSPMGNAAQSGFSTSIDFGEVIAFVERHCPVAPFAIGLADNIGYWSRGEGRLRGVWDGFAPFQGCEAGLTSIGIDSVGNVRGCESMYDPRFIEGNLRERSLGDIWTDPESFAYNRKFTLEDLTGRCRDCVHGSICAGGCRSYNYFSRGKLYEAARCACSQDAQPAGQELPATGALLADGCFPE